ILICVGAYVVAIGAGLSCPTWPQCFADAEKGTLGNWFPFLDPHASLHGFSRAAVASEWVHRFVAGIVSFLIVGVTVLAWRLKPKERGVRAFSALSLGFLVTQIALGGITVLNGNQASSVVLHQANAMVILCCLVALNVLAFTSPHRDAGANAKASAK